MTRGVYLAAGALAALFASCAKSDDNVGGSAAAAGFSATGATAGAAGKVDAAAGTSGSGGTSGTGGTSGSGGTGGGVLEGAADVGGCEKQTADSTCGTFPQCGCDVGQQCDVIDYSTGRAVCIVEGSAAPYAACFTPGLPCSKGLACVGTICKPYCDTSADCPGPNRECIAVQYNDNGVAKPVPNMLMCTSGCDPVNPSTLCGSGLTCAFVQPSGPGTDCFSAGTQIGVGTCSAGNAGVCAPGHLCVNNAGSYDCLKWCRMSNPNDCTSPSFCQGLQSTPTINGVQYGVCT